MKIGERLRDRVEDDFPRMDDDDLCDALRFDFDGEEVGEVLLRFEFDGDPLRSYCSDCSFADCLDDRLPGDSVELLPPPTPLLCRTSEPEEDVELFDSLRLRFDELFGWELLPLLLLVERLLLLRDGDLLRDRLDFCEDEDLPSRRGSEEREEAAS
ncbi:uncharacterized protein DMAD_03911 [Drosophila madeirensis]|uniref:Uncharacterized protein n=1 Tax=Drosophila madeirensis TaxID=30013 RepID=A0AAU9GCA7_DROMD